LNAERIQNEYRRAAPEREEDERMSQLAEQFQRQEEAQARCCSQRQEAENNRKLLHMIKHVQLRMLPECTKAAEAAAQAQAEAAAQHRLRLMHKHRQLHRQQHRLDS